MIVYPLHMTADWQRRQVFNDGTIFCMEPSGLGWVLYATVVAAGVTTQVPVACHFQSQPLALSKETYASYPVWRVRQYLTAALSNYTLDVMQKYLQIFPTLPVKIC